MEALPTTEDLEDGEIESDGEEPENVMSEEKKEDSTQMMDENHERKSESKDFVSKSGKKKKNKSRKGDQKPKEKRKKNRNNGNPSDVDFAGNIEKAIKKAMNRNENDTQTDDNGDNRRKYKKRKKYDKDGPSRKRKKQEYTDEMDESEMMCIRGASPVQKQSPAGSYEEDDRDSYASDSSQEDRTNQPLRKRQRPRDRNKNNKNDRRRGAHPMQDPDGVCVYFMQGKCHKGDDCIYSHDAQPPRKMELCKFYLMECCAKRDKCLYMHADFPCKYYHTGIPCIFKDECKFAHGKPLSEGLKNILLKHIESAPKEILGDFPRLNREGALKMIQSTQVKLMQQYPEFAPENNEKSIPSLFEINVQPQNLSECPPMNQYGNHERQKGISPKVRHSRWQNDNSNANLSPSSTATTNVLNIKNLNGVLTPRQISDFSRMGIENLDQLGQLTVLQLNSIGISLKQITEIQLNTMNIQKLGLINNSEQPFSSTSVTKDLDLRVAPPVAISTSIISADSVGRDVDMRFQPPGSIPVEDGSSDKLIYKDIQTSKDMIDIDQYTKDALKFASKDKENIDISNETLGDDKLVTSLETKDIDHRVLPFSSEIATPIQSATTSGVLQQENDTDIRFLQPEPIFKNPEKRHRRSTTDDEDNNLLIDEKWYSSDEEKGIKRKSPVSSPHQLTQSPKAPAPHVIEPSTVLSKLGDLSKIDISAEVTKLLNTMKNNLNETPKVASVENSDEDTGTQKSRDPRSRRSPEKVSEPMKQPNKRIPKVSIYECIEGEPTDGRRRNDVDLRQADYKMPSFGDTDLRPGSSGDIDFRLSLPFKPIPNFTPASEIDGSINSHPPIPFKLVTIQIPRPDYTDIKNSTAKSQALVDPRLRKVFRLSIEESNSDSEKSIKIPSTPPGPRVDPRRKKESADNIPEQKSNLLDLQTILQNSNWYKDLSTTQKIFVNQNLAPVTQMIKQFQQEKTPNKKFDLSLIQGNSILGSIFTSLCVTLGENGEFSYLPKPKEALLKTPVNFNQNIFGMNSNVGMDGNNMNMMNASMGMSNMNVGPMHNFNQSYSDPRGGPQPGLLGIAPNMHHNFNNQFGGPNNNFGNMGYNGQGPDNDFNFMEGNPNFQRFPNRGGGHRGRGNDRWNRGGGSIRGPRDRKNFNDRGHWKAK